MASPPVICERLIFFGSHFNELITLYTDFYYEKRKKRVLLEYFEDLSVSCFLITVALF
jgi:hypothetical protein